MQITFRSKCLQLCMGFVKLKLPYNTKIFRWYVASTLKRRMKSKIGSLRTKDKIRIGFLVQEASKWGYQSIYDIFANDLRFEVIILPTKLFVEHNNGTNYYKTMSDCQKFFADRGMNVIPAYNEKTKEYVSPSELNIDILFYQQPFDLVPKQHPFMVSKYAITCYAPYGLYLMQDSSSYTEQFHRFLDFYFIPKTNLQDMNITAPKVGNCYKVGYAKLDEYSRLQMKHVKKPIVIYAPHHSFEDNGLHLATFQYNAYDVLSLAKKYSDRVQWIFKPHPRLKHAAIINNIMTETEINKYYNEWNKIGQVYETGDYLNLFSNSCALITDCSSFLGEYLPSGHPIFHLINKRARFNDFAESFICDYYKIHNINELYKEFDRVVINKDDYKKTGRLNKTAILFDDTQSVAEKIYQILIKQIWG